MDGVYIPLKYIQYVVNIQKVINSIKTIFEKIKEIYFLS
jgi:hypothetical protein